jgi:hypothetical protein
VVLRATGLVCYQNTDFCINEVLPPSNASLSTFCYIHSNLRSRRYLYELQCFDPTF